MHVLHFMILKYMSVYVSKCANTHYTCMHASFTLVKIKKKKTQKTRKNSTEQVSANCGRWTRLGLLPVFLSTVLLAHGHIHSLLCCPRWLPCFSATVEQLWQTLHGLSCIYIWPKCLLFGLLQKNICSHLLSKNTFIIRVIRKAILKN